MERSTFIAGSLVLVIAIGILAVFFASPDPDGLESTALVVQGDKTLTGETPPHAEVHEDVPGRFSYQSPMPDYTMGEGVGKAGELLAIVAGILLVFIVVFCITHVFQRRVPPPDQ